MFGSTLICDRGFTTLNHVTNLMSNYYFKSCTFSDLEFDGGDFGAVMIFCELQNCQLYWTIMTSGLFVSTKFSRTEFNGLNFAGAKFIECTFEYCNFVPDNLGGHCDFEGAKFIDCVFQNTSGAPSIS